MKYLIILNLFLFSCSKRPSKEFLINQPITVISGAYKGCQGYVADVYSYSIKANLTCSAFNRVSEFNDIEIYNKHVK